MRRTKTPKLCGCLSRCRTKLKRTGWTIEACLCLQTQCNILSDVNAYVTSQGVLKQLIRMHFAPREPRGPHFTARLHQRCLRYFSVKVRLHPVGNRGHAAAEEWSRPSDFVSRWEPSSARILPLRVSEGRPATEDQPNCPRPGPPPRG